MNVIVWEAAESPYVVASKWVDSKRISSLRVAIEKIEGKDRIGKKRSAARY